MNDPLDNLRHLVQDLFAPPATMRCDEVQAPLATCAAAAMPPHEARLQYPTLWQHLDQCRDCAESYALLTEMLALEQQGALPKPASIPPPPDGAAPTLWEVAQEAIKLWFGHFSPSALAPVRSQTAAFHALEPVRIELVPDHLELEVALEEAPGDPAQRQLVCYLWATGEAQREGIEGAQLWLQRGDFGAATHEARFDAAGEAVLAPVDPGRYTLRLQIGSQLYAIQGVEIL